MGQNTCKNFQYLNVKKYAQNPLIHQENRKSEKQNFFSIMKNT